jgi:pimeloyl-ACP methyl ester carboxylesterase
MTKKRTAILMAAVAALPMPAQAAPPADLPAAIYTDPPVVKAHPARMETIHVQSGGVTINGVAYLPVGEGPHPVALICHGWPGNEKNLDLAQALRRAGWAAVTFNYRGSWGSQGKFRFAQNPEDAAAVLTYLSDPAIAKFLGVNPARIVVMGHSMGGWVTTRTGASNQHLAGLVMISATDRSWSDHRIDLEARIIRWLASLPVTAHE